jgi:putative Mg2+ transporter-C (MgtC) family protein
MGAAITMITGEMLAVRYGAGNADPSRLAAQVVSGIGFLGAGTILKDGVNVRGLTTAASLWATACLGIAAGAGLYAVAFIGTVAAIIALTVLEKVEDRIVKSKLPQALIEVICSDASPELHDRILAIVGESGLIVSGISVARSDSGSKIELRVNSAKERAADSYAGLCSRIASIEGIIKARFTNV